VGFTALKPLAAEARTTKTEPTGDFSFSNCLDLSNSSTLPTVWNSVFGADSASFVWEEQAASAIGKELATQPTPTHVTKARRFIGILSLVSVCLKVIQQAFQNLINQKPSATYESPDGLYFHPLQLLYIYLLAEVDVKNA